MKTATRIALLLVLAVTALLVASPAFADDAARLDPLVVTATAPVPSGYVAPAPDDAGGWLKSLVTAVRDTHWKLAAGAALMLAVWAARAAARKWGVPGGKLELLTTKWGSRGLLVFLGVGTALGQAWAAGVPISFDLVAAALETTAAGFLGWEIARPRLEPGAVPPKALA